MTLEKKGSIMNVTTISGDFAPGWQDEFIKKFRLLCSFNGCTTLGGKGRPGWTRMLKRLGFAEHDDFLEVKL